MVVTQDAMDTIFHNAIQVLAAVSMPPLLLGVIAKTKAFFAGRVGAPLWQPYYDLFKLFRKGAVFSTTTTWVFRAGPVVGLMTAVLAALMVPFVPLPAQESVPRSSAPISFLGDMIVLAYVLGLGRFFTAAAALDTGSAFEGMGAAREVAFSCLVEPAFILGLLVLTKLSGSLQLAGMFSAALASSWTVHGASMGLVLLSWFVVLLVENSRIPFDDPNTHLELTMIHEVMVLDHGGPALGMILYGAALKLFIFAALIVRLSLPSTGSPWLDWPLFAAGVLIVAMTIGVVESCMARLRLTHVPTLLVSACLLSAFGIILLARAS
jgi:formate hydrogenlyase subunit 4